MFVGYYVVVSFSRNTIENVLSLPIRFFGISVLITAAFYYGAVWYYAGEGMSVESPFTFLLELPMFDLVFPALSAVVLILLINALVLLCLPKEPFKQRLWRVLRVVGYAVLVAFSWAVIELSQPVHSGEADAGSLPLFDVPE